MSEGVVGLPQHCNHVGLWLTRWSNEHRVGMSIYPGCEIDILGQQLCGHFGPKTGLLSRGATLLLVMAILRLFWPGAVARTVSEARYILVGMMAMIKQSICWSKDVEVGELMFVVFCQIVIGFVRHVFAGRYPSHCQQMGEALVICLAVASVVSDLPIGVDC